MTTQADIRKLQDQARLAETMRQMGIPIAHVNSAPYADILYLDERSKTWVRVPRAR